jgi:McrBC 5-methylcytosine restriction system component
MGKRSGFISLGDGANGTLTLTILPKAWASTAGALRQVEHKPGTTTHAVAHELDFLHLTSTPDAVSTVLLNLTAIAGVGETQLLEGCPSPPERPSAAASVEGSPFGDLLDLFHIANRSGLSLTDDMFMGGPARAFSRVLTYERFLRLLEPVLFRARPRYFERTTVLSAPKGRLNDEGLLVCEATGQPWVLATFDDLTMDTQLLQVARAALHTIVADRLPKGIQVLGGHVDRRAVQLARHLTHVTPIHREHALILGERLWLSSLDRNWQPVLEAGLGVLRQYGPTATEGTDDVDAFVVHVLTEKFWEQALAEVLITAFGDVRVSADRAAGAGVNSLRPWQPSTSVNLPSGSEATYPDYMFRGGVNIVVGDAKYKLTRNIAAQDGYQLFAYSHLAALEGQASNVAVVLYPRRPGSEPAQVPWQRRPDGKYRLWVVQLPFPSRDDMRTSNAWTDYIFRTAARLNELAQEWSQ